MNNDVTSLQNDDSDWFTKIVEYCIAQDMALFGRNVTPSLNRLCDF